VKPLDGHLEVKFPSDIVSDASLIKQKNSNDRHRSLSCAELGPIVDARSS
jgi:hypothetical protein